MSYEASAHRAQMKILRHLLLSPSAGFAELQKRTDLTSDHANFHIKKLVEVGYIGKDVSEKYTLTRVTLADALRTACLDFDKSNLNEIKAILATTA